MPSPGDPEPYLISSRFFRPCPIAACMALLATGGACFVDSIGAGQAGHGGSPATTTSGGSPPVAGGGPPDGGMGAGGDPQTATSTSTSSSAGGGGASGSGGDGGAGGGLVLQVMDLQVDANDRDSTDDGVVGDLDKAKFGDAQFGDVSGYAWPLPIPPGAIIQSAFLRLVSRNHQGVDAAYTARIRIEDVADAAPFNGNAQDIRGRSYWGTTVDWPIPMDGLPLETQVDSPSIAQLIQHAVNKPSWQAGNDVNISIRGVNDVDGCYDGIYDWSDTPSKAAILHVEWLE